MILAEMIESKKEALRVAEVAKILDLSVKQIYRLADKGQIPFLKISSSIRFAPPMILPHGCEANPVQILFLQFLY